MDTIREYLLSVTAGAILCAMVCRLVDKKGIPGAVAKLLTGLFMTFIVLSPLTGFSFSITEDLTDLYRQQARDAVLTGEKYALDSLRQSIKSQSEAYILNKAAAMGAEIEVQVTLSDDIYPVPETVSICGQVPPYVKTRLRQILEEELGVLEENQIWN